MCSLYAFKFRNGEFRKLYKALRLSMRDFCSIKWLFMPDGSKKEFEKKRGIILTWCDVLGTNESLLFIKPLFVMHQVKNYTDLQNISCFLKRVSNINHLICNRLGMKSDKSKHNLIFQVAFTFKEF